MHHQPRQSQLDPPHQRTRRHRRSFSDHQQHQHPQGLLPPQAPLASIACARVSDAVHWRAMTGTILNVLAIVVCGILGLYWIKQMTPRRQMLLKVWLGIFTVLVGLSLTWKSLGGGLWPVMRQMIILVLALTFGRLVGKALRIQVFLNRMGEFAKRRMADAQEKGLGRPNEGFVTCTVLFCFAPLAVIGPLLDGIREYWQPLAIKAVMDGLGALAFVNMFGKGVLLSALPVLAWQGTI